MEYATVIKDTGFNEDDITTLLRGDTSKKYNEMIDMSQYVGWSTITSWDGLPRMLFCKYTIDNITKKVSEFLKGFPQKIVPSEKVVVMALYNVFQNHIPRTGDIYGKFTVVDDTQRNDYAYIVDKTISLLVQGIRTDLEMLDANSKLTIWTTVLGDFNEHGLRQHPPIKLRERGPDRMLFHMKY